MKPDSQQPTSQQQPKLSKAQRKANYRASQLQSTAAEESTAPPPQSSEPTYLLCWNNDSKQATCPTVEAVNANIGDFLRSFIHDQLPADKYFTFTKWLSRQQSVIFAKPSLSSPTAREALNAQFLCFFSQLCSFYFGVTHQIEEIANSLDQYFIAALHYYQSNKEYSAFISMFTLCRNVIYAFCQDDARDMANLLNQLNQVYDRYAVRYKFPTLVDSGWYSHDEKLTRIASPFPAFLVITTPSDPAVIKARMRVLNDVRTKLDSHLHLEDIAKPKITDAHSKVLEIFFLDLDIVECQFQLKDFATCHQTLSQLIGPLDVLVAQKSTQMQSAAPHKHTLHTTILAQLLKTVVKPRWNQIKAQQAIITGNKQQLKDCIAEYRQLSVNASLDLKIAVPMLKKFKKQMERAIFDNYMVWHNLLKDIPSLLEFEITRLQHQLNQLSALHPEPVTETPQPESTSESSAAVAAVVKPTSLSTTFSSIFTKEEKRMPQPTSSRLPDLSSDRPAEMLKKLQSILGPGVKNFAFISQDASGMPQFFTVSESSTEQVLIPSEDSDAPVTAEPEKAKDEAEDKGETPPKIKQEIKVEDSPSQKTEIKEKTGEDNSPGKRAQRRKKPKPAPAFGGKKQKAMLLAAQSAKKSSSQSSGSSKNAEQVVDNPPTVGVNTSPAGSTALSTPKQSKSPTDSRVSQPVAPRSTPSTDAKMDPLKVFATLPAHEQDLFINDCKDPQILIQLFPGLAIHSRIEKMLSDMQQRYPAMARSNLYHLYQLGCWFDNHNQVKIKRAEELKSAPQNLLKLVNFVQQYQQYSIVLPNLSVVLRSVRQPSASDGPAIFAEFRQLFLSGKALKHFMQLFDSGILAHFFPNAAEKAGQDADYMQRCQMELKALDQQQTLAKDHLTPLYQILLAAELPTAVSADLTQLASISRDQLPANWLHRFGYLVPTKEELRLILDLAKIIFTPPMVAEVKEAETKATPDPVGASIVSTAVPDSHPMSASDLPLASSTTPSSNRASVSDPTPVSDRTTPTSEPTLALDLAPAPHHSAQPLPSWLVVHEQKSLVINDNTAFQSAPQHALLVLITARELKVTLPDHFPQQVQQMSPFRFDSKQGPALKQALGNYLLSGDVSDNFKQLQTHRVFAMLFPFAATLVSRNPHYHKVLTGQLAAATQLPEPQRSIDFLCRYFLAGEIIKRCSKIHSKLQWEHIQSWAEHYAHFKEELGIIIVMANDIRAGEASAKAVAQPGSGSLSGSTFLKKKLSAKALEFVPMTAPVTQPPRFE